LFGHYLDHEAALFFRELVKLCGESGCADPCSSGIDREVNFPAEGSFIDSFILPSREHHHRHDTIELHSSR